MGESKRENAEVAVVGDCGVGKVGEAICSYISGTM
jgi:hypothetical protein